MRRLSAAVALGLLAASCGGSSGDPTLTVFAASSLSDVFRALAPNARLNFAGSDELATQIREGAKADVYAAASPRYPDELHAEGLIERPRVFATNRLVLIVPSDNPAGIEAVADLRRPGTRLVVGAEGVPIGDYTRKALAELGETDVLSQVVSQEDDVKGVVSKVAFGEADAGFVYATDVKPVAEAVSAIELPPEAQADVLYPIAVVVGAEHRKEAERLIELVLGERGRAALRGAGFDVP
jgi:molybdate transport system substrate-binding protein